ncbi:MAG: zinc ribbon domain-containing protein [Polyangiales bacterium]
MPTYEYRCNACGKEFEYQQKMADPDLTKCEACGEDKLEKLISWSAFQLKGDGWYKDLYSKQSPEQQKQAARDSVDKGVPPKKDKDGTASTDAAAKPAASDATSSGSSGSSSSSTPAASTGGAGGGASGGGSSGGTSGGGSSGGGSSGVGSSGGGSSGGTSGGTSGGGSSGGTSGGGSTGGSSTSKE